MAAAPGLRNLKKASFKSVKYAGGDMLTASNSRSGWDDRRSSKDNVKEYSQQDQYSSHKVLISGKHIAMHLDSISKGQQQQPPPVKQNMIVTPGGP